MGVPYVIRSGDTIFLLSKRFHIPMDNILHFNPKIDPDNLQIGQTICLPLDPCPENQSYTIQAGDTFYRLANRYGLSVDAIVRANPNVNPDALQIGQKICMPKPIPVHCPSDRYYIVQPGDTLYKIATRYNVTVESIMANLNPHIVDPNRIPVGLVICIP
ncbi:hypothetical protein BHU72_13665 [Desulfuribacillus stibiiarsenatis]|uniref:LysM domain-containing protein n=2 Tax=Desulfuribacillus stibiiarsenatis TaxID=1390249 RepID=A0A1E5L8I0_9FIRM|nr:hypothetical protein BHU72_13665 [Desulfuribacillus stibiiarsenatis]